MSRMPSVGDVVDDVFRVEEELDHGNFGAVFKVADLLEQRTLAMKVLKPGPHDEEELRQRFEREARLIYSLRHPHVVQVFYYGETDSKLPYMAMEYLQGTDLKALLAHHGGLSEPLARRIAIESLAALHCAHAMGIIHRDLKPANIYLVNDGNKGHVKVLDFGFAKALESDSKKEITNAGTLVGTPAYMSPELVHKKDVGPAADIYAMGLILAEMLTGDKVVAIDTIYDTIIFQGSEKNIKLPAPLVGSPFEPIIARAIAKNLDDRYTTAVEMIDDLRALDLDGVGPFTADVQLTVAPPEVGTADTEAHTRPRSDGRPSMTEIDAALGAASHPPLSDDSDDPTIERQYSFQSPQTAQSPRTDQSQQLNQPQRPAHQASPGTNGHNPSATMRAQPRRQPQPTAPTRPTTADEIRSQAGSGPSQAATPSPTSSSSPLRDILFGLVVGLICLAIALYALHAI